MSSSSRALPLLAALPFLAFAIQACQPSSDCPDGGSLELLNQAGDAVTVNLSDDAGPLPPVKLGGGQGTTLAEPPGAYHVEARDDANTHLLLSKDITVSCKLTTPVNISAVPGGEYPAPHPAMPSLLANGGPVLTAARPTVISFPGDELAPSLETMVSRLGASPYWAGLAEYGVGAATAQTPVRLSEAAPNTIDDSAIQTWLTAKLDGTHPEFGTPSAQSVYVILYPTATKVTAGGMASCQDFLGYHNELALGGGRPTVAYAVINPCPALVSSTLTDQITSTTSHELAESATDPYPNLNPAYVGVDSQHSIWETLLLGENGDLCSQFQGADYDDADVGFNLQRTWSNASAAAGHDPCVPVRKNEAYFNSAPVLNETVTYRDAGSPVITKGVNIPVGQSKTIELDLYSDGPVSGPWTVSARDLAGGSQLSFSFDRTTGLNGDKLQLTIHALARDPDYGAEPFVIRSVLGGVLHVWLGVVGNSAASAAEPAPGSDPVPTDGLIPTTVGHHRFVTVPRGRLER